MTGMYLLTEQRWYLGTVVMMRLQQMGSNQDDPDHSITVHARAVRWGTDGVGMAFLPQAQNPCQNSIDPRGRGGNQNSMERFIR